LDKVYSDFKDWTSKISNKFDVGIMFKVGIIRINFKFLFIRSNLFSFHFFGNVFVVYIFPWIYTFFSILLPTRITKFRKFETKNKMLVGEGVLIQLFNIFTKLCCFYFSKENEGKIYFYIMIKYIYIYIYIIFKNRDLFSSFIINHLYECMINVVKQIWYWELNGYVDYLIFLKLLPFLPI
jgi:hypothetical protein